jgi:hypothetical protein
MILRPYWGKAGTALISIAIISGLADVTSVTTSSRSHIPLWPLYICAILFILGLFLFALRIRDKETSSISKNGKADANKQRRQYHLY